MSEATGSEKRLDRGRASPHPQRMAKDEGKPPPQKGSRDQKLAAALRANLRRRKAAAPPTKPPKSPDEAI